jgi:hypothetical protein
MSEASIRSIVERVVPVEIDSLTHYEKPSRNEISKIAYSLRTSGHLRNPIVVDIDMGILIDGHHRAEAFRWLGFSKIPAFIVSYLSDDVRVGNWSYAVDAPDAAIQAAFNAFEAKSCGDFGVVAKNPSGQEIAASYHQHLMSAARYLEHVYLLLSAGGYAVKIVPDTNEGQPKGRSTTAINLSEPLSKEGVIEAVSLGLLYPRQVNRHLIDCRPLALNFPLLIASSADGLRHFCESSAAERRLQLVTGPSFFEGRFYEERTLKFIN